jgi:diaminopimelate epimerase
VQFLKVEGLGNDFLLLDRLDHDASAVDSEVTTLRRAAPGLCDRRTGVGGDGILVVAPPRGDETQATMIVINHDGSRPEMCGNGVRCVAHWLAERLDRDHLLVDTDAGVRDCQVLSRDPRRAQVAVGMGPARHLGKQTPAAGAGRTFADVSMGNPHAICFVGVDEDPRELAHALGPQIEVDPAYPDRTNVEFAKPGDDGITLWVWERGCGITGACGTGACATAAAAVAAGLADPDEDVSIKLPGGVLHVRVPTDPEAHVVMTGPAAIVFSGDVEV